MVGMMALRQTCRELLSKTRLHTNNGRLLHTSGVRFLFSSEMLGIENYKRQRSTTQERIGDLQDLFRKRMNDYMQSSNNTIFTGDLKNMIYAAANEEDLETTKLMIDRFRKQRGELRFSNFVFGPLVMRMCHLLNQPDLAYELFTRETANDGFFDQMSTFVVLMDLLFENGRYDQVLEVMQHVKERRVAGLKFPNDCLILLAASCCKLNTPESYGRLQQEIKEAQESGNSVSLRTAIFSALLAVKQNDPSTAMDILGTVKGFKDQVTPASYTNLKVLTYAHLGREEDAILELRCLLNNDGPTSRVHDVFPDVVNTLQEVVEKGGDSELIHRMTELRRGLEENSHMHLHTLEEFVFGPIVRKRKLQDGFKSRQRSGAMGYNNGRPSNHSKSSRRGLLQREDLNSL